MMSESRGSFPNAEIVTPAAKMTLDTETSASEFRLSQVLTEITQKFAEIGKIWAQSLEASWAKALAPLNKIIGDHAQQSAIAHLIEKSGWLPHKTTPFNLIGKNETDLSNISTIIGKYYEDNWDYVEDIFSKSLTSYEIDDEARAAFKEALSAHRSKLYRASCRTLFPEIERVARNTIYNGKLQGIASLPELYETVNKLPAADILSYMYGIQLFEKFGERLYTKIGDDPAALDVCKSDPVPNRHAVIHGLVSYVTPNNSINALIMTDFLFHLITVIQSRMSGN